MKTLANDPNETPIYRYTELPVSVCFHVKREDEAAMVNFLTSIGSRFSTTPSDVNGELTTFFYNVYTKA